MINRNDSIATLSSGPTVAWLTVSLTVRLVSHSLVATSSSSFNWFELSADKVSSWYWRFSSSVMLESGQSLRHKISDKELTDDIRETSPPVLTNVWVIMEMFEPKDFVSDWMSLTENIKTFKHRILFCKSPDYIIFICEALKFVSKYGQAYNNVPPPFIGIVTRQPSYVFKVRKQDLLVDRSGDFCLLLHVVVIYYYYYF